MKGLHKFFNSNTKTSTNSGKKTDPKEESNSKSPAKSDKRGRHNETPQYFFKFKFDEFGIRYELNRADPDFQSI